MHHCRIKAFTSQQHIHRSQDNFAASVQDVCIQGSQLTKPKQPCMPLSNTSPKSICPLDSTFWLGSVQFNAERGMWLVHQRTQRQQPDNCQEWRWRAQLPQHKVTSPRWQPRGFPESTFLVLQKHTSSHQCEAMNVSKQRFAAKSSNGSLSSTQLRTKSHKVGTRCDHTRRCEGRGAPSPHRYNLV
jgi:hypothetical protein